MSPRPSRPPRAVLFDMDGTLVDSECIHYQALLDVMAVEGISLPDDFGVTSTGLSIEAVHARIAARAPLRLDVDGLSSAKTAAFLRREAGLGWRRGARDALDAVEAASLRVAIVSNSDRLLLDAALRALGLQRVGRISVSRNDVRDGKPAPEPYLRAAWLLQVEAGDCLVVEDSPIGAAAALAAGMAVIAWPEPDRSDLRFPDACLQADPHDLATRLRELLFPGPLSPPAL